MNESNPALSSTIMTARQCAVDLLAEVLEQKRALDEAMARHKGIQTLELRDRQFSYLLVMTTLRRLGQLDQLINAMLAAPLKGRTQTVKHILRVGAAQLLYLGTPPHAAVNSMVETAEQMGFPAMKGVVNAVLKRVAREGADILIGQDAGRANVPDWLYASWEASYGADAARAIAQSGLNQPPLDLSVKEDAAHWAAQLGGRLLPGGTIRLDEAASVESLPGYAEGAWWVQDWAASLPAKLLGDVKGLQVLDACAAPGGKTAQLAAAGAVVTALDQSERRLMRLNENLERLGLHAECVAQDLLKWKPGRQFDAILLDAPCTATGTLRRHPEMVWRVTPDDIAESAKLQARFLARASGWLKPGGRIVYSVCSLQPEEGEERAQAFLLSHPGFRLDTEAAAPFAENGQIRVHAGRAQTEGDMDGFYAACLLKLNDN